VLKKVNIILILIISLTYVQGKNFNRIKDDIKEQNFINFPWPNYISLNYKEDYVSEKNNNFVYNKRIYSKKLIFDNTDEYILMCGNINFPCISEGKEICLGNKEVRNTYSFFINRNNNLDCAKFMNNNILY
tara:strand:+ start:114 stop:506 length:393 start_codon:yes stop_codon:yes gene_type:complete